MIIAEVFVNIPVKSIYNAYSYIVPESLSFIGAGWRVIVPFGGRRAEGFVINVKESGETPGIPLKAIEREIDDEPWFTPRMIEISRRLSDFYLCPVSMIMRLFMPGLSGVKMTAAYFAAPGSDVPDEFAAAYGFIESHPGAARREIARAISGGDFSKADSLIQTMLRKHLIEKSYAAKKRVSEIFSSKMRLIKSADDGLLKNYSRKPAQKRLILFMAGGEFFSEKDLKDAGFSKSTADALVSDGVAERIFVRIYRDSYKDRSFHADAVSPLSDEQQSAVETMRAALTGAAEPGTFLLHGVTGSGKTRVYIESARLALGTGRSAIVLVPEIALTGQLVENFRAAFSGELAVIHSRLSVAERNDAMARIRRGDAGIIIGARSALFAPASDVGLIIMDEEQDMSYKQDETPRYSAREVAATIARVHGATLILGSATPSMESYYSAKNGGEKLITMRRRVSGQPLPEVFSIDMRDELRAGNRSVLSRKMQEMLRSNTVDGRQSILMLNRRGYSTFIMCRACGYVMRCKMCTLPLVYHSDGSLACHHCDVREEAPKVCPSCGSSYIKYFGSGTEKLESELKTLLPGARAIRMDRDATRGKFSHDEILGAFRRGEYDILLGTQMVSKGHDIPRVTMAGILSADSALFTPDFRAPEKCFTLIEQTAGRAGRGEEPGRVAVQCYTPEHYAVKCAINHDYESFFEQELEIREELFLPPFCRLIKLTFQNADEKTAESEALKFKDDFEKIFSEKKEQVIIGPAPDRISNFRGVFRYSVLIKSADLAPVRDFLRDHGISTRNDVIIDIDPIS